ncbi:MAG: methylmalonyl-CoA mutase family protein, partial [Rhodothermia bacterium]
MIVPEEISELEAYGISRIFSPDDGMAMGLQGMIDSMLQECDVPIGQFHNGTTGPATRSNHLGLAHVLSAIEHGQGVAVTAAQTPVIGITGTGGAGKSTLTDELVRRLITDSDDAYVAVLSVDPTRKSTGGALLGDRIRMNAIHGDHGGHGGRVYMRSFATRQAHRATSAALLDAIQVCRAGGFDVIFVETAGIGQSDTEIADLADLSVYVMTHDFGAPTQLEKLGMLDVADFVVINKFEKKGSLDALRDVRKQVQRNRGEWDVSTDEMPVYPTMASHFNDPGVSNLYLGLLERLNTDFEFDRISNLYKETSFDDLQPTARSLIPGRRQRYLAEIADSVRDFHVNNSRLVEYARKWGQAVGAREQIDSWDPGDRAILEERLDQMLKHWWGKLDRRSRHILENWDDLVEQYSAESLTYKVRDRDIHADLFVTSLSGLRIPRVALPETQDPGERLRFALNENLPGYYPYTAGVFPFKRVNEDPTRMFAGEGSPERTNRRFHLVSLDSEAKRLSSAFDSVTLYGA